MKQRNLSVQIFRSFEEEATAEYIRRSNQSPAERMNEFAVLQERCFGRKWTSNRIENVVSFEKVVW